MNVNVYQHFRIDEHPFIDSVTDWLNKVANQYAPYLTDFLDPRQAYIVETLARQTGELKLSFYGGHEEAERRRCLIYPDYYEPVEEDFEISTYEIHYPQKFATLSHGKVLGTLVNAGIRREAFGDIITDGLRWQVFLTKEISQFIEGQITKIANIGVHFNEVTNGEVIESADKWQLETITVSSLRLDVLVSSVYNISRQRSKQLIESGKVKVNWVENTRPDFLLDQLDIVSVRGFGRIQFKEVDGKTKKDKHRIMIGVLRK